MNTVRVKICGLTREEDVEMVCRQGADAVGFMVDVPSSPRNLSITRVKQLFSHVPLFVKRVIVTVPQSPLDLQRIRAHVSPDILQIHGDACGNISDLQNAFPSTLLIKALSGTPAIRDKVRAIVPSFDGLLLDSLRSGIYGGTGMIHDWTISKQIRDIIYPKPLILAGGLTPNNVQDAINVVSPYAVDVSTGVESRPGVKDPEKVSAFIRKAKDLKV